MMMWFHGGEGVQGLVPWQVDPAPVGKRSEDPHGNGTACAVCSCDRVIQSAVTVCRDDVGVGVQVYGWQQKEQVGGPSQMCRNPWELHFHMAGSSGWHMAVLGPQSSASRAQKPFQSPERCPAQGLQP